LRFHSARRTDGDAGAEGGRLPGCEEAAREGRLQRRTAYGVDVYDQQVGSLAGRFGTPIINYNAEAGDLGMGGPTAEVNRQNGMLGGEDLPLACTAIIA